MSGTSGDGEGVRLAKRVAALAGCSRREAELLIENGAVRVDGAPALLPQSRVLAHQQVEIEAGASGLVVYTQEWRIERKLQEDAGILEHEVMVDVAGAVGPEQLARFERSPARVSIGRQADDRTGLRFAIKGPRPGQIAHLCDQAGLRILAMRRIRIGRVPLAGLLPGQWRYLSPHERF